MADWLDWSLEARQAKSAIRNPQSGNCNGLPSQTASQGDGAPLQALRRPRGEELQGAGEARGLRGVEAGPDHGAGGDYGGGDGIGAAWAGRGELAERCH